MPAFVDQREVVAAADPEAKCEPHFLLFDPSKCPNPHGCSAISRRTSSWLEEQGQRPAMQRAGTLRYMGPPRPVPLLNRPRGDKCSKQGKPSQANRGPKNLGRSRGHGLLHRVRDAHSTIMENDMEAASFRIQNWEAGVNLNSVALLLCSRIVSAGMVVPRGHTPKI